MAERITGHTELIGLMAYPIRHSSSPAMHNEAFAYLGLDYAYLASVSYTHLDVYKRQGLFFLLAGKPFYHKGFYTCLLYTSRCV